VSSEREDQNRDEVQGLPHGAGIRRSPRSGEGMDSVLAHLREQESQRVRDDDPTIGIPHGN
jgi:hypothetical protein